MSTSLLFHAFGIRGYQLQKTEFSEGKVYFYITQDKHNLRCPACKSSKVICRGKRKRTFKPKTVARGRKELLSHDP